MAVLSRLKESSMKVNTKSKKVNKAWLNSHVNDPYAKAAQKEDRKSTRLNSSHLVISYAVFCLKKKKSSCFTRSPSHSNICIPQLASSLLRLPRTATSCAESSPLYCQQPCTDPSASTCS